MALWVQFVQNVQAVQIVKLRFCEISRPILGEAGGQRLEQSEAIERLERFERTFISYGADSFFKMFAASLGALRIDAAMLPASSPVTKRGGEPWLLVHSPKKAWSRPIA